MKLKPTIAFCLSRIETFLGVIAPRILLNYRRMIGYGIEPELALLPMLCNKNLISLDIGANAGMYTFHMLRDSKMVYSFEPNPRYTKRLVRCFPDGVIVYPIALSNKVGECELRIPMGINGAGTLEKENDFGGNFNRAEIEAITVPIKTLDEFEFKEVGFIKIDVEGYENTVLEGAIKTIVANKPAMLIEIEERHRQGAISQVKVFLSAFGYKGYFLIGGKLHSIENLNLAKHQSVENMRNIYINNFAFLLPEHLARFEKMFAYKDPEIKFEEILNGKV